MEKLRELLEQYKSGEASAEDIESAVESHVEEESEKLKGENYKLRQERRELREQLDSGDGKSGKGGSSKEVYELQDKVEELTQELEKKNHELEKVQKAKGREVEQLTAERDQAAKQLDDYVLDQELTRVAGETGVFSDSIDTFQAHVRAKGAKLERSDDGSVAVKVGEKPLGDFVEEWKQTPGAKRILADSAGGQTQGAPGRNGKGSGTQGKNWSDMTLTERTELAKSDPDTAAKLKAEG
ncbi:MAG: hypothetical protein ACOCZ9_02480 [Spirochaetota bacterium]